MQKVNCPHCASPAVRVSLIGGYKFYCSRCGWNHEIVRRELSSTIKVSLFLIALGVILAAVVRVKSPNEGSTWALVLLAFSGLPLFYILSALRKIRKLRNLQAPTATHDTGDFTISEIEPSTGAPSKTILFKEKSFPELAVLPRPRKLTTTWKGRGYVAFGLVLVGLYTFYGLPAIWREFSNPHAASWKYWMLLVPPVVIYGYSFVFFRNRLRERQLLANGELASGYVTAQHNGEYTQSIQYCFRLAGGKLITGRCNDASRSLYEGMTVPVFFDSENPKRSIPLDCSLTKIASVRQIKN